MVVDVYNYVDKVTKMNFYIGSKLENYKQVQYLANKLKSIGWTQTFDWTLGSLDAFDEEALKKVSKQEADGVKCADVFIVLTPQGRGTHTELGIAIALEKRIYICHIDDKYFKDDENTSAFYWHPKVKRLIGNIDDIFTEICQDNKTYE